MSVIKSDTLWLAFREHTEESWQIETRFFPPCNLWNFGQLNYRDRLLILPNVNYIGFSFTGSARAIRGVAVTASTISARVIYGVSVSAAPVVAQEGYHACTGACVIHGATMTSAPVATRAGYHSWNYCVRSRHNWVGESTQSAHGVNVMWCWVTCNNSGWLIKL